MSLPQVTVARTSGEGVECHKTTHDIQEFVIVDTAAQSSVYAEVAPEVNQYACQIICIISTILIAACMLH